MEFKPMSGREFPRYSAIKTFFRLPQAALDQEFDVGIVGVPFDGGVSYRPGARFAPTRVRETSSLGRGFNWARGENVFERLRVADLGDCSTVPIDLKQTYERIESHFSAVLKAGKHFLAVGGDHSITLPLLRAVRRHVGRPVNLIHFDAHLDTYPAAWGCEYHHGAFVRHAVEENLIDPKNTLQLGLRGPLAGGEDLEFVRRYGVTSKTIDDLRVQGLERFLGGLPLFSGPTYITYDIDCLDPAYAPGTGTPVPGGLTTYEVQRIFRALKIEKLVACDVVELSPPFDHSDITALAVVDAIFEMLCLFKTA
ncbi:MAG: agmatinase [Bdellovibrionales bacterium]